MIQKFEKEKKCLNCKSEMISKGGRGAWRSTWNYRYLLRSWLAERGYFTKTSGEIRYFITGSAGMS